MSRTISIFNNKMSPKTVKKAEKQKSKYLRKFGDDSQKDYQLYIKEDEVLSPAFDSQLVTTSKTAHPLAPQKAVVIGNIRMGYGHYRIAMAIASAAKHLGYTPYWFDMSSFTDTAGGKLINHLNDLYSLGSRLSQKSVLFDKLYWEPLTSKAFSKLDYNAVDQKVSELMTSIFTNLPKDLPFIGTHAWTAQAAVHAGMDRVVNIIPDNWPMALHLAEGSIHTVQTPSSYIGYKTLKGMSNENLNPMPEDALVDVGHYIDHELLVDLDKDTAKRVSRIKENKAKRILLTVGGAGAQYELYRDMILKHKQEIEKGELVVYINCGDHSKVVKQLASDLNTLHNQVQLHEDDWQATQEFAQKALDDDSLTGVHIFYHEALFAAVYTTNLLMRSCDILVTKPSELAFYPVPKLMIKRVGGHEAWGAIRAAEIGDGTSECTSTKEIHNMLDLMLTSPDILLEMNKNILKAQQAGIYDGAYKAVELAVKQ